MRRQCGVGEGIARAAALDCTPPELDSVAGAKPPQRLWRGKTR